VDVCIVRDGRESLRKCSLAPLRGLQRLRFFAYASDQRWNLGPRILLHPDGAELSRADRGGDLLLIDCAWRRVEQVASRIDGPLRRRRLPELHSAYPRVSRLFADPANGLASVEALYAALLVLGEHRGELLAHYRWREAFLQRNPVLERWRKDLQGNACADQR
jgi:pre-rRNA-processing protein TSR3